MQKFISNENARIENFLQRHIGAPKILFIKLIRKKKIKVNDKVVHIGYKVVSGDIVTVFCNIKENPTNYSDGNIIAKMIFFETENFFIINKTNNISSQGGLGITTSIDKCANGLANIREETKYFLIHRLDYDVSGVMVIAKNINFCQWINNLFLERKICKIYIGIVHGNIKKIIKVCDNIDGKEALSIIYPIEFKDGCTICFIKILSGRKHQIKIHCENVGFPILYEKGKAMLHCFLLGYNNTLFFANVFANWKSWINLGNLIIKLIYEPYFNHIFTAE